MALTRLNNRSITAVTALPSGITMPTGTIIQVQHTFFNSVGSQTIDTTWRNVEGLSVTITPKSTNSKIYLLSRVSGELNGDEHRLSVAFTRNGTLLSLGQGNNVGGNVMYTFGSAFQVDDNDSTPACHTVSTLDTPNTTSPITYRLQMRDQNSSWVWYYNRTVSDNTNSAAYERLSSEITAFEIAG